VDNINKHELLDRQIEKLYNSWDTGGEDFVQQLNQLRAVWAGWRGLQLNLDLEP
jgi:hypothetical protein